jgi:hypothetical protein
VSEPIDPRTMTAGQLLAEFEACAFSVSHAVRASIATTFAARLAALRAELLRRLADRDRLLFATDNAAVLVPDLEAQVARQRAELARLNHSLAAVRTDRDRLRDALTPLWGMIQLALHHEGYLPDRIKRPLEAHARAVLTAAGVNVGE